MERSMDKGKLINEYLDCITGKKVKGIGRTSDTMWLRVEMDDGRYLSFEIPTAWRIINSKGKMEVASYDVFLASTKSPEIYAWKGQKQNLFDEKSQKWIKKNPALYIKECDVNVTGDLKLLFDNGDRLEVFSDCSEDLENFEARIEPSDCRRLEDRLCEDLFSEKCNIK